MISIGRDNIALYTEQMFLGEVLQHFSKLQYYGLKILLYERFQRRPPTNEDHQTMKERDNTEQMFLGEVLQHFSKLQYHDLVSKILLYIRFQ
jgi:hypothetical protein